MVGTIDVMASGQTSANAARSDADVEPFQIDVCVCTFQRESLAETLRSLAEQEPKERLRLRVIVADNDDSPSAQERARGLADTLGLNLHYVHAPARNISIARNACLEAASAALVAFIDDDEVAEPRWLVELASSLISQDADAIIGPVRAIYGKDAPTWVRTVDLHSTWPKRLPGGYPVAGYTSNAMVRRNSVGSLRFDPALGRSGGEDSVFFDQLRQGGGRLAFCPDAVVTEKVPVERESFRWLLRRNFRAGQTYGRVLQAGGAGRAKAVTSSIAKLLYCGLGAIRHGGLQPQARKAIHRAALHLGVLATYLGHKDLQLYG